jgi:hypothetical protein
MTDLTLGLGCAILVFMAAMTASNFLREAGFWS